MDTSIFILKVLLLSLMVSLAIKYAAPFVTIVPTPTIVLTAILSPSLLLMMFLTSQVLSEKSLKPKE